MNVAKGLGSTIGSKTVMAVTGLLLFGWVIAHLLGNLQIFAGRAAVNEYAVLLKGTGPLLWVARLGLLALAVLHVAAAVRTTLRGRAARPVAYEVYRPGRTTYAARTMMMSGVIVLAFVVYHLLHFTIGVIQPENFALRETLRDTTERHDVYGMMVAGFSNPWVALAYVVAQALLAMHITHGVSSAFQTLGVTHPRFTFLKRWFGPTMGALIFLGFASIPVAVLLGFVK